jgi:hypothetical protein
MRRPFLAAALVTLLAAAPAHAATWTTPANVSSAATFIDNPFIGFGSGGSGLAAWNWAQGTGNGSTGGERGAVRSRGGSFGPERRLPTAGGVPPALFGADGVVIATEATRIANGAQTARVRVSRGTIAGSFIRAWTSPSYTPAGLPAIAANAAGDIAVAYIRSVGPSARRQVLLAERQPDSVFTGPRVISGRGRADAVTVAVGRRGDLVVAWERDGVIYARSRRGRNGALGSAVRLGRGARLHTSLQSAVSRDGRAWVMWVSQRLDEGGGNGAWVARIASTNVPSRTWRALMLDRYRRRASDEARFALTLASDGTALAAWTGWDGAHFRARAASLDGDFGALIRTDTLSAPDYDAVTGDVAASPAAGQAVVVWSRLDSVGELGTQVIAGPWAPRTGPAGPEEIVSADDRARLPSVAYDPISGRAVAVWSQRSGPDGPGTPIAQVKTFLRAAERVP